ncbi:hypothetical protein HPG69_019390 [Diceros bicornis minor]|uniref:Uncharacterized protein n=1 Tax=Diceros bicornis minor TaxID=77932 RepID=A0A7J7E9G5_DICBM|nr:hypothetical protein HPG69_019390 [Diceros bicornis minor]
MQQHECTMNCKAYCGEVYSVEFSYDENTVSSIGDNGKIEPCYEDSPGNMRRLSHTGAQSSDLGQGSLLLGEKH